MMVKLRVVTDDFFVGSRRCTRGEIIEVPQPSIAYATSHGCEVVDQVKSPAKKKRVRKPTYKTRVVKAEE